MRFVVRPWWIALLPFLGGTVAGILAYQRVPAVYRSETLIAVSGQGSDAVAGPIISDDWLVSVSGEIMTDAALARIIAELGLYLDDTRSAGDRVQRMREDIGLTLENRETFRLSYVSGGATVAQKVTERLAALYVAEAGARRAEGMAPSTGFQNRGASRGQDLAQQGRGSAAKAQPTSAAPERPRSADAFRITQAASLPQRPVNETQRLTVLLASALAGLAFGFAVVLLLAHRGATFNRKEDVLRLLSIPVLAAVPLMQSERRRTWLSRISFFSRGNSAVITSGLTAALLLSQIRW